MHILLLFGVLIGFALFFGTTMISSTDPPGSFYKNAFYGSPPSGVVSLTVDPDSFDGTDFIDSDGLLRPGTPFQADGTLADGVDEPAVYILPYSVKIAPSNVSAVLTAASNNTIGVATGGDLLKSAIEANLGRALTADEIANITATGRFLLL